MKPESLHDLFLEELRTLYHVERQISRAWLKVMKSTSRPELQNAFQEQLHQTQEHAAILEQIFGRLGMPPRGKRCQALGRFLEKGREVLKSKTQPYIRDASLTAVAQKVEHYKMAGYGSARIYSRLVGDEESAVLLQQSLNDEENIGKNLTRIAGTISA